VLLHWQRVMKKKNSPEPVALTSFSLVELPGIETAYYAVDLREWLMSQHGSS
jgi:hypothetical protein